MSHSTLQHELSEVDLTKNDQQSSVPVQTEQPTVHQAMGKTPPPPTLNHHNLSPDTDIPFQTLNVPIPTPTSASAEAKEDAAPAVSVSAFLARYPATAALFLFDKKDFGKAASRLPTAIRIEAYNQDTCNGSPCINEPAALR
ncbi:hypothetical protein AK830_g10767 [Neonectria ditissima]|uniref:Uncharacterized protein n=1 Tax=Neonectria ditissima TaxID=78410 RepID=A0A0P7B528_9HYPO|nr:hypothetical protein AK830_g10767 [Neonectria ditissima]